MLRILLILIIVTCSGCASYLTLEGSRDIVKQRKAYQTKDAKLIEMVRLGDNGVGMAIDVGNLEAIKERPWMQLGAGLLDTATILGLKYGIDSVTERNESPDLTINVNGNENNTSVIVGEGNTTTANPAYNSYNAGGE